MCIVLEVPPREDGLFICLILAMEQRRGFVVGLVGC